MVFIDSLDPSGNCKLLLQTMLFLREYSIEVGFNGLTMFMIQLASLN